MGLLKGIASVGAKVGKALAKGAKKTAEKIKETGKKASKKAKETAEKVKEKISGKKKQETETKTDPEQQAQQQPEQTPQQTVDEYQYPDWAYTVVNNFMAELEQIAQRVIDERGRSQHVQFYLNRFKEYASYQDIEDLAESLEQHAFEIKRAMEQCFYESDQKAVVYFNIAIAIIRNDILGSQSFIADSIEDTATFYFDDYEEM